jgi:hypothetical protein
MGVTSFVQYGSFQDFNKTGDVNPTTYGATFAAAPTAGNLLLLALACQTTSVWNGLNDPPGYSILGTYDMLTQNGQLVYWYKIATGGEGSVITITDTGAFNETSLMMISEYSGIDGDDPFHDGATFTGSQVDDNTLTSYTTATMEGTREMLYLSWGQWDSALRVGTEANGFSQRIQVDRNSRTFEQWEYIATIITPRAAAYSWDGGGRFNGFIVGFSGSLPGIPKTITDQAYYRGIFRGINRGIV